MVAQFVPSDHRAHSRNLYGAIWYCIEPGIRLDMGDELVDRGEDF